MPLRPFLLAAVVGTAGILVMQQTGIGPFGAAENVFSDASGDAAAQRPSNDVSALALNRSSAPTDTATSGPEMRIAQAHEPSLPGQAAPSVTPSRNPASTGPVVDETALRYFAAQGDTRRLEAEIARLRALYPDWVPPENPLAAVPQGDPQLDQMWKLYSEGRIADVRKAISDRQTREPGWQVPSDLLDRLQLAEAREQLVNASDIKQYDTVVRVASANPAMLTCGDIDVLWRVGEAFARTDRRQRALDAYLYILRSCEQPQERLATIQKAAELLPRADLDQLLALERTVDGKPEFEPVRGEIARRAIVAADADPTITVSATDLALVEKLANAGGTQGDDLLLGWYYLRRDNPAVAETWFRKAVARQRDAASSQGLALALINQDRPQEAEAVLYEWRDASDDVRAVYLAAIANMLALRPSPQFAPEVLQRVVAEVAKAKDSASAEQLGWYADNFNQFDTAERWFRSALEWGPDSEPAAFGLALMRWKLGDQAGVRDVQTAWAGRSDRIPIVGERSIETAALAPRERRQVEVGVAADPVAPRPVKAVAVSQPRQPIELDIVAAPAPARSPVAVGQAGESQSDRQPLPQVTREAAVSYVAQEPPVSRKTPPRQKGDRVRAKGCRTTEDPEGMSPQAALTRGWCLMEANRPVEAAKAFEVALRGSGQTRSDAAYGQSLAYMRVGLTDLAAVSATKAPVGSSRSVEINAALLSQRATSAFQNKRYVETLLALDERARIVPEPLDLMVLRGYAYMNLIRYRDAERVFRAAASAGNRDAMRGLNDLWAARNPASTY
ncbi:MAG: tetratricopeptide repeat protein [Mesorhizobium sp.]|nr:cellulose synthase [Mesorhizobium sp.]MBL8576471.1 tetratricopeptide repeat protein [Mesorhizobium sp.]